jgi:hypothetical protein
VVLGQLVAQAHVLQLLDGAGCQAVAAGLLAVSSSVAGDFDGITLSVSKGPSAGAVRLDWTGGQPMFGVFRLDHAAGLVSPANRVGLTSTRNWPETPPAGTIYFYRVELCVAGAEQCNGLDDSCDGVVDEGNPGGGAHRDTGRLQEVRGDKTMFLVHN